MAGGGTVSLPYLESQDDLADLVGLFYDAALDNELWNGSSERIAKTFGATSTVLKLHRADEQVALVEVTPNMVVADDLQEWAAHWHSRDLWVERSVSFGLSRIVTDDDLTSDEERRRSGFYREWLSHLGIYRMLGAAFSAGDSAIGVLGIHRPEDAAQFGETDRQRAAMLLPHLKRALTLSQRIAQTSFAHGAGFESLDAIDTGVMIADAGCRVLHMNTVAEALLDCSAEICVTGSRLTAHDPALRSRLNAAVHAALCIAEGDLAPAESVIRIGRAERPPWTLAVFPLRPRWPNMIWQRPLALILMRDPEYPPFHLEMLRAAFGFTRTEALVAARLAQGTSPTDIGHTLNIGMGTVRTHLKQILLKTGAARQAEAVAIISRSIAASGRPI